jgi:hypothetical protein
MSGDQQQGWRREGAYAAVLNTGGCRMALPSGSLGGCPSLRSGAVWGGGGTCAGFGVLRFVNACWAPTIGMRRVYGSGLVINEGGGERVPVQAVPNTGGCQMASEDRCLHVKSGAVAAFGGILWFCSVCWAQLRGSA